jgi:hypothetical protein
MNSTSRATFAVALTDLAAAYGKTAPPAQADAYWSGLEDLPIDDVLAGMAAAKRMSKYFPTVAVIRSAVAEEQQRRPISLPTSADLNSDTFCGRCEDTGWEEHQEIREPDQDGYLREWHYQQMHRDDLAALPQGDARAMYPQGRVRVWLTACGCRANNPE